MSDMFATIRGYFKLEDRLLNCNIDPDTLHELKDSGCPWSISPGRVEDDRGAGGAFVRFPGKRPTATIGWPFRQPLVRRQRQADPRGQGSVSRGVADFVQAIAGGPMKSHIR